MNNKIDYRNSEACRYLTYKDMSEMTLEDAIYIVSQPVKKFHEAKTDADRMWLPRAHMIKAYELLLKAANEKCEMEKMRK